MQTGADRLRLSGGFTSTWFKRQRVYRPAGCQRAYAMGQRTGLKRSPGAETSAERPYLGKPTPRREKLKLAG